MSLTITQQPSTLLQSANNDSYYVVYGTTYAISGVTEYKYVADVYVNSVLSCTLKSFPDPLYGFGLFNMRNIADNFVSYDAPIAETGIFQPCLNSFASIQLKFREEYISGSTFLSPSGTTNSDTFEYINSALDYVKAVNIDFSQYVMDASTPGKFLQTKQNLSTTYFPAYTDLRSWLSFYTPASTVAGVRIATMDITGGGIGTNVIDNPFTAAGVYSVATGMAELSGTVDFADVATYEIELINSDGTAVSEIVSYQVLENCGKFAPGSYKLYWLDQFGEFNSWYFTKKNTTTLNTTTSTYKKIQGTLSSEGTYTLNTFSPSIVPFYTAIQDQTVLSTDFLSDNDVIFLKGAFRSPAVYMEDASGTITAVTIAQNSYVLNKTVNVKPYALQLTVQSSSTDFSQLL